MPARNLLAFDLGAESGRALLGRLDSGRLSLTELHRFANTPARMNSRLHWNLLSLWESLKTGLRNASAAGSAGLHGLGVDTWGVDFGLIGRNGEVLGLPVCYRDSRTDGILERTFQRVPRERIFQVTGVQFLQFNTLFQLLAMRECRSSLLEMADRLLMMPDLLHYLFTGQAANEFSAATTTQMYDPRRKDWAWDLLRELDLPSHFLGPIVPSGTILGRLSDEVAAECGVQPFPVITPASHDTGSAVLSVPAEGSDWCYISSGTWSLLGAELDDPLVNDESLALQFTNEGGVDGKIRFLKNIFGLWLVQECRRQWEKEGQTVDYAQLTEEARNAPAFRAILPNLDDPRLLAPENMPELIRTICRETEQPVPGDRGETVRCALESLALKYRRTLRGLDRLLGRKTERLHIIGGGTQNQLLCQMTADACGIEVITGPVEATALGNIGVQAMATGALDSLQSLRAMIRVSTPMARYEPRETDVWEALDARFSSN